MKPKPKRAPHSSLKNKLCALAVGQSLRVRGSSAAKSAVTNASRYGIGVSCRLIGVRRNGPFRTFPDRAAWRAAYALREFHVTRVR